MKWHFVLFTLPCLSSGVLGFPAYAYNAAANGAASKRHGHPAGVLHGAPKRRFLFDPTKTPINVNGDHKFIPPNFSKGDQRGPCPALNALANHGYISRDGVTSLVEVSRAIDDVFGMGPLLGGILSTMSTVFAGNPLSLNPGFSIGDTASGSQNLLGNLLGLLGTPRGLNGSHNIIEGDSSNTRADLYMTGDASTMVLSQFQSFYDLSPGEGNYNFDLFMDQASARFKKSVATNPDFYYGPFTGMIARNAGYFFAARLFANYSKENPADGVLNKATLKSFYGVHGGEGSLTYKKGCERIPKNWYRIPVDYDLPQFNLDLIALILKHPEHGSIGGNMGATNTYAGVDISNLTGGLFNGVSILESNNLMCFAFEAVKTVAPNSLSTLFSVIEGPLKLLTNALDAAILNLACPAFDDLSVGGKGLSQGLKEKYPGARLTKDVV